MLCSAGVAGEVSTYMMRDLEADRPDATESPITVDSGHWQVESSFVAWSRDRVDGVSLESLVIGETNLKYGLTDQVDLQFVYSPYVRDSIKVGGQETVTEGHSDLEVRAKINLWGNDGGDTAMALMPYVRIPTKSDTSGRHWEGGLIAPFAMGLTDRIGLGLQGEVAQIYENGSFLEFSHTAVLGFDLTEKFGAYVEYLGVWADEGYESYGSGGLTYDLQDYLRLDVGAMVGLNDLAEDLSLFTGMSWKF